MREWHIQAQHDPNLMLMYSDSMEVSLLPTITRCWTRIGQQRHILTPGVKAPKQWCWGAVNVISGESVALLHPHRNQIGCRRLLAAIARHYDLTHHPERQVVLFLDNDKAHKARTVERLVTRHPHIRLEWLPTYTPELNPQEDLWQHLRRRVTHNYYFGTMDRLTQAVVAFHAQLQTDPQQVLQLISKWTHFISA